MIEQLVRYASDNHLVAEPGFAPKVVRFALVFDPAGHYVRVHPFGDAGRRLARCPDLSQPELIALRGRHFLVDTAEVVARYAPPAHRGAPPRGGDASDKRARDHRAFLRMLRCAASGVPAPLIRAVIRQLRDEAVLARVHADLSVLRARPTDKVTLDLAGELVADSELWHPWWRTFRSKLKSTDRDHSAMLCLATGAATVPVPTHPKVVGLANVGGLPQGDVLVGFDKDAFQSYGLEQSANAATSEAAAAAYRAALNDLLRPDRAYRLPGARVAHWYSGRVADEDDPIPWIIERAPGADEDVAATSETADDMRVDALRARERASRLLDAIRTGERADVGRYRYYVLVVSGAAGRVMVRDWTEGSFEDLVNAIAAWFGDLAIVRRTGVGLAGLPKLERLVTALLPAQKPGQQYDDWTRPVGPERLALLRAALGGRTVRIPDVVAARVVAAFARSLVNGEFGEAVAGSGQRWKTHASTLHARMALLRAYHIRQGDTALDPTVNEHHPDPAYHCGRLVAVLADLQRAAIPDVGAGVVERYYASASATPALVLGRLVRGAQPHLSKLGGGLAYTYESRIGEVMSRIGDRAPATLSPAEQSLFALGFYQQLAAQRAARPANADKTAPAASADGVDGSPDAGEPADD